MPTQHLPARSRGATCNLRPLRRASIWRCLLPLAFSLLTAGCDERNVHAPEIARLKKEIDQAGVAAKLADREHHDLNRELGDLGREFIKEPSVAAKKEALQTYVDSLVAQRDQLREKLAILQEEVAAYRSSTR